MDAINIAATALNTHQAWLNAISNNIANVNTAKSASGNAFQAEYLEVQEQAGNNGVAVEKVVHGDPKGRLVYDPTNAVADKDGYVRMPDIDLGEQMSSLIMAQRGYQANAAVVDRAKTTYEAALQIGRS
ncbi:flagellar basal body rod protein FlgC [Amnibacterium kyonggiense]|jgi:flagellar basal-body rod protein FlgC|uniref:Flagellar basal-body rod protein FlgC n=1 Tax=Amnibacterium kyonggiense TaxID=595671 RepID=A0A4R7FR15_9MICO|nr:flagellar basal body rod C-terminal domain-containing protein [Amnibacterium kyonggiense]TDS80069.1 flagellar basal-body rod protein FlgC [Amnibacterium kyonggiense]